MSEIALILDQVKSDYQNQNELYRPASFWENSAKKLVEVIVRDGLKEFRNDELMCQFFVPKYGVPTNSFDVETVNEIESFLGENGTKKQKLAMKEFLSGYFHALSDYRVFLAADRKEIMPNLASFSECKWGKPIEQYEFDGKFYSRSSLNYLLGLCLLKRHLKPEDKIETIVEIGGGFGTLGEILSYTKATKYIDLDISPTSFVAHQYLEHVYGINNINEYNQKWDVIEIEKLRRCSVLHSWQVEQLEGKIDLFVNFISFQEMELNIIQNYLNQIKKTEPNWILLRNIKEGKQLRKENNKTGVLVPIVTEDYIKMLEDQYELIDRNIFPFGYKTVDGFHSELTLYKRKGA